MRELINDGVFAVKVVVEIAYADAGTFRDFLHRRRLDATLAKARSGSGQNLLAQIARRTGCHCRHFASAVCVVSVGSSSCEPPPNTL